jgi:hypothetical protein
MTNGEFRVENKNEYRKGNNKWCLQYQIIPEECRLLFSSYIIN